MLRGTLLGILLVAIGLPIRGAENEVEQAVYNEHFPDKNLDHADESMERGDREGTRRDPSDRDGNRREQANGQESRDLTIGDAPRKLSPPGKPRSNAPPASDSPWGSAARALMSLLGVIGLFLGLAWLLRRASPKLAGRLPPQIVEDLGWTSLIGKGRLHLVRCGNKLILVHANASSVESLAEITDPAEVDRLAGLCRQSATHSSTQTFRQLLSQFGREPAGRRNFPAIRGSVATQNPLVDHGSESEVA